MYYVIYNEADWSISVDYMGVQPGIDVITHTYSDLVEASGAGVAATDRGTSCPTGGGVEYILISSWSFRTSSAAASTVIILAWDLAGGLKACLEEREEEMGSFAWMATGYCLPELPMAEPDQEDDLGGGGGGGGGA